MIRLSTQVTIDLFELYYVNPFVPNVLANIDSEEGSDVSSDDNFMLFASLRVVLKTNFSMFTEIIIDDFQIDKQNRNIFLMLLVLN